MPKSPETVARQFERAVEARCRAAAVPRRRKRGVRVADVAKAIKAARAAGLEIARIEMDPAGPQSKISIVVGKPADPVAAPGSELDEWIAKHADSTKGS
jgi:hypothetical protein